MSSPSHVSRGLSAFINAHSTIVTISCEEFIDRLSAAGLECDLRGHRLIVVNPGRDYQPEIVKDQTLVQEEVKEIFGWAIMLHAGHGSELRSRPFYGQTVENVWHYEVEDDYQIDVMRRLVKFDPKLGGAGHLPKGLEAQILRILGYTPHEAVFSEMLAKVSGHYWPDVDAGMQSDPDIVEVTCLASEVAALAAHFTDAPYRSDYRNCVVSA